MAFSYQSAESVKFQSKFNQLTLKKSPKTRKEVEKWASLFFKLCVGNRVKDWEHCPFADYLVQGYLEVHPLKQ